jgi:hypothetical protein
LFRFVPEGPLRVIAPASRCVTWVTAAVVPWLVTCTTRQLPEVIILMPAEAVEGNWKLVISVNDPEALALVKVPYGGSLIASCESEKLPVLMVTP